MTQAFNVMDYHKKALDKIKQLEQIASEQFEEIKGLDAQLLQQIRKIDGPQKKRLNDIRNQMRQAMATGDMSAMNSIVDRLKNSVF